MKVLRTWKAYKTKSSDISREMLASACMRNLSNNNLETMARWGTRLHINTKKGVQQLLNQGEFLNQIVDVLNRQISIQQHAKRRMVHVIVI